jgi:hypothetical protein
MMDPMTFSLVVKVWYTYSHQVRLCCLAYLPNEALGRCVKFLVLIENRISKAVDYHQHLGLLGSKKK